MTNNYPPLAKRLFAHQIRFAGVMSILALVLGLVYREVSRGFLKSLSYEQELLYGHNMSLVHGHTFLLGAVIPIVLALLTLLVLPNLPEKRLKNLNIRFDVYMAAASVALALMIYKGLAFIAGAGQPLEVIDASLFWGNRILRGILFGVSHATIFWAVGESLAGIMIASKAMLKK
jgi:nitric oxide reductase large subunit